MFRQTGANFDAYGEGEKELSRPYVNAVKIKLIKDKSFFKHSTLKDDFLSHKSDFQVHEQDFRIIQMTTFNQLKIEAWDFWGLKDPDSYCFFDSKLNLIMSEEEKNIDLSRDGSKNVMTVDKFFETFLLTKPLLFLMKPQLKQEALIKMQRESVKIRQDKTIKDRLREVEQEADKTRAEEDLMDGYSNIDELRRDRLLSQK